MKNFIERLEELKCYKPFTDHQKGFTDGIMNAIRIFNELHPSTEKIAPEPNKAENLPSFKVRVTKCSKPMWWYENQIGKIYEVKDVDNKFETVENIPNYSTVGYIDKSDCEIIPETQTIAFDYQRWKDGDFLRVVDGNGLEVTQLKEFDVKDTVFCLYGVRVNSVSMWDKKGNWNNYHTDNDLHLEIAIPKSKQVTTYHWMDSTGNVRGSMKESVGFSIIGETITEQQPDGTFKIISTTLK